MKRKERTKINNKFLKQTIITTTLLLILALNLTSNIFLVSGDAGGTGKYLEISFAAVNLADQAALLASSCEVTATKVTSEQTFTYIASASDSHRQKVGAGTVFLEASTANSPEWVFIGFDDSVINGEYKTEKNDIVTAKFERLTYEIKLYVVGGIGEIKLGDNIVADESNGVDNPATVIVGYGDTPTFEFIPYVGDPDSYHLSSVLVDGTNYVDLVLTEFTQSYEFAPINEDFHSLAVAFSVDGEVDIPPGSDVTVFLSSSASLKFNSVGEGSAFASELYSIGDVVVWDITVAVIDLGDQTIIAFRYDPSQVIGSEEDLRMYRSDSEDAALYYQCDLNDDGVVNGQDNKIIANAVKRSKFWDPEKNPEYDLNNDNAVTEEDVHIVNSMKNVELTWIDITFGPVDTVNNIIYGLTDHFSIFRAR